MGNSIFRKLGNKVHVYNSTAGMVYVHSFEAMCVHACKIHKPRKSLPLSTLKGSNSSGTRERPFFFPCEKKKI